MKYNIKKEENIENNNVGKKVIIQEKEISNLITKESISLLTYNENDFTNKDYLTSYINNKYPSFFETFDLLGYINKGSSGVVYRGIYKGKNKKQVAIKFLMNEKIKKKRDEKKDLNPQNENHSHEISLAKKLHNKNITEIYGYYKNENMNFSVLEFGKHGDMEYFLKRLLRRNTLPEAALNYFGKQILDGLDYIHRCKIAHMDIKPGNILINSNLEVKITDFSVSCSYLMFNPNDIVKFPLAGTGRFIAPEIISNSHIKIKESEKIDIYSFGVTLFYLFYGEYPYNLKEVKSKDYNEILQNIKKEELMFPTKRTISKMFKDFLTKVLEKDYTKRITIKQALNHPWIKGSKILFDEKENIDCQENFLIRLITENIPKFKDYIS